MMDVADFICDQVVNAREVVCLRKMYECTFRKAGKEVKSENEQVDTTRRKEDSDVKGHKK